MMDGEVPQAVSLASQAIGEANTVNSGSALGCSTARSTVVARPAVLRTTVVWKAFRSKRRCPPVRPVTAAAKRAPGPSAVRKPL